MTIDYAVQANQRKIRHIFNDDMQLCGCGTDSKYEIVKSMLERAEARGSFYEPLGDTLSAEAVEFIAHVMDHWKLLEHGGSIGYAWLTENGETILQFLRDHGTDTDTWPMWWCSCDAGEEW